MNKIRAVIFDLDNTIIDRTGTFRKFTESFLQSYFQHIESTQPLLERIIRLDQDGYKDKKQLFNELLEELPWRVKPQHEELMNYYRTQYVKKAMLFHQAREILQYCTEKYRTGLITNGRNVIQYGKIDQLEIRSYFDVILVSEEAGCKKPDPRIFEMTLNQLQLPPDQCLYIGDHPANDIEGASKVGMKTIWFKVNQPWKDDITVRPLHTIVQLHDLFALI